MKLRLLHSKLSCPLYGHGFGCEHKDLKPILRYQPKDMQEVSIIEGFYLGVITHREFDDYNAPLKRIL